MPLVFGAALAAPKPCGTKGAFHEVAHSTTSVTLRHSVPFRVDFVVAYLCGSIHEAFSVAAVLPEHGHGLAGFILI